MKRGYYILSFLLLWPALLFAQGGKFTATASSDEVAVGQQFEVEFDAQGNASDFTPPDFTGFQVLSGPNLSQSMTSVNGATNYSTGYSYILAATKEGTYTIGAASINLNMRRLKSNPIKIKVDKVPAASRSTQQAQAGQPDNGPAPNTQDISKSLFLKAEVDKTRVYQGEQLTVTYKLYTRVSILGSQADKAPDLTGFWNQDVTKAGQAVQWQTETYKGQRFNVATLKQTILFPEHPGDLKIDPLELTLGIRIQQRANPNDIFDQMFGDGGYKDMNVKIKSQPITIHAMPLPDAGKPANFSGAVGRFTVDADVDKKELKANETFNYNVKISGKGNLSLINAPNINPPADFEKYDPKVTDNIIVDAAGVSGSRQYTYLLIPRHQGDYTFAPPGFSYFDPESRRYITLPAKTYAIKVNKGDAIASAAIYNSQQDVKVLGKDIRYIKTSSPDLYKDGEGFYGSGGFYFLLLLGPLAFAGALLYRKWDEEQNSDVVRLKSRRANKIAAKHLAMANKQLVAGDKKAFYEAVARGLYGYLSDKLNIPVADLNKDNITGQLKVRGLDDHTIKQLDDTMDLCEMARFAPVSGISEQQVFDQAKNTINEIEDKI
jgi:hypothetical protein